MEVGQVNELTGSVIMAPDRSTVPLQRYLLPNLLVLRYLGT